ncbi:MAG: outer membrane beta-barrel protein [Pseudomonadales bacterium]|nr:outer membrane beta-barrel protein [Pseudomonadales bacterium]MCP5172005.1 outer membrane beta-barrel protein [Pseudomonadales bacterium]
MFNKKPVSAALSAVLASGLLFGAASTMAHEEGTFILRVGAATVAPNDDSDALSLNGGDIAGSGAEVNNNTQLGITATYMLSDNLGIGVLAATPFEHDVDADTGALGLGTVDAASLKHLPPTVTLQYFPLDNSSAFQPYVGAGLNYTAFFSEDVDSELEGVLGSGDVSMDSSWGLALEAGFDYSINEKWVVSAQVWYLDIDTEAEFRFTGATIETDVEIDPWVYNIAIGYKF